MGSCWQGMCGGELGFSPQQQPQQQQQSAIALQQQSRLQASWQLQDVRSTLTLTLMKQRQLYVQRLQQQHAAS
jgi:hypothetical protein